MNYTDTSSEGCYNSDVQCNLTAAQGIIYKYNPIKEAAGAVPAANVWISSANC